MVDLGGILQPVYNAALKIAYKEAIKNFSAAIDRNVLNIVQSSNALALAFNMDPADTSWNLLEYRDTVNLQKNT